MSQDCLTAYIDGSYHEVHGARYSAVGVVLLINDVQEEYAQRVAARDADEAELLAALIALKHIRYGSTVHFYTDSLILVDGMVCRARTRSVLWEQLDYRVQHYDTHWHWVKGHSGQCWNERAHTLAYDCCKNRPTEKE